MIEQEGRMLQVWNKRHRGIPEDAVYVGRPTKWGNPFSHQNGTLAEFKVASKEAAILAHKEMVLADSEYQQEIRQELRGKHLVCWCAPKPCHADILLEIANG